MAKSELEIVSKMLRYKAEVEDKSYPRVVVRQLCDAVLGHNRDAVRINKTGTGQSDHDAGHDS